MADSWDQQDFEWVEIEDRFPLGMCLTLVSSTEVSAILDGFHTVRPRGARMPADADFDEWMSSMFSDATAGMRFAGQNGEWTWVLEEVGIAGGTPPLPQRLSGTYGRAVSVLWTVNLDSRFVYARHGDVLRDFELGREAEPGGEGLEGYLDEEDGLDWEQWMSAGLCLQARVTGVVALPNGAVDALITETA
ncbi:DUF6461 domain-containing protein [Nocardia sp. CC227C]|uniref:DUF6461 domain-containing protein n=1 Tax=Nocardia sp. CC227C TaxID=3044562 RepID=UPI00278C4C01|nr:DUF6461 domain-containing protein [Nocardia sp. CC227C]